MALPQLLTQESPSSPPPTQSHELEHRCPALRGGRTDFLGGGISETLLCSWKGRKQVGSRMLCKAPRRGLLPFARAPHPPHAHQGSWEFSPLCHLTLSFILKTQNSWKNSPPTHTHLPNAPSE